MLTRFLVVCLAALTFFTPTAEAQVYGTFSGRTCLCPTRGGPPATRYYADRNPAQTGGRCRCDVSAAEQAQRRAATNARVRAAAAKRQAAAATATALKIADAGEGVLLRPGPRGALGHARRCDVATDAKVIALLKDQSRALWHKAKPLFEVAVKLLVDSDDTENQNWLDDIEAQCRQYTTAFARTEFVNKIGGEHIEDVFKQGCELDGHLDGVAEGAILGTIGFLFDTPAGEYLSLVLNKVVKGKWPNTVDFCGLVCRKNNSGNKLKRCLIGCPETHPSVTGCWSQCSLYTCRRACKNAFPTFINRRRRKRCYRKCEGKCSYD